MSRHPREYPVADRYDDGQSEFYRRPRRDRDYEDLEVDITRERYPEERRQRSETLVKERDSVVSERRGPRQPDFLREDYGKSTTAGALVVREERREDDGHSRVSRRRRSVESARSRPPPERTEEETKIVFRERERERAPPYPQSQVDDKEEIIYRERTRSRPPPRERGGEKEEIDIRITRDERESRPSPPRSEAPPVEEIRFRRGGGDRPGPPPKIVERTEIDIRERERSAAPPPARSRVEREEIDIRERHSPASRPPRSERGEVDREEIIFRERRSPPGRGRATFEEINIRESSAPPPRHRSMSRPQLVARKEEEWVVRRQRTPSPPPPRDYEKEEIIIRRRKERTPSPAPEPEPPREPTPEPSPPPPPPLEPIYRPPIIQEVITHHRHIDHGVERARSPTPPPPPAPVVPSPPPETKEENLEIEIRRKGTRNGKAYEEDFTFEKDTWERENRAVQRHRSVSIDRKRSMSVTTRRRSPSRDRRHYEDELDEEAEYYNRKIASRAYPGEAYNGATRDWSLVDVPPGTERVRMDGVGGGAQEITWQRYNGERRGKFISGDRVYEAPYGNGHAPAPPPALPAPAPAPPREERRDTREEIKITMDRRTGGSDDRHNHHHKKRDKMWTEVTKDLVIKEAIEEMGYEYEESDEHFYVMEYLKYEDVLHLVQVTEDIKRERRERIREIQWQREERERTQPKALLPPPPPFPALPRSVYEERIYEREYIIDRDGRRFRR